MRWESWIVLVACLIGAAFPLYWLGANLDAGFVWVLAIVDIMPFVLIGLTAWSVRGDRPVLRKVMIVALVMLGIGLVGWLKIWEDRTGFGILIYGFFVIPLLQLLVWFAGPITISVIAKRRRSRSSQIDGETTKE